MTPYPIPNATQTEWRSQERRYQINLKRRTFTKIEIPSWIDIEGKTQKPWKSRERLMNEYMTLKYIGEKTTIPVPKPLHLRYINGCLAMTTEWIDGVPFDDLDPQTRSTSYLDEFVRTTVLPQLKELTSRTSGTIQGEVLPPRRLFDIYPQRQWCPRMFDGQECHITHNDLSQHNFLCNEKTGKVEAIIDWEFAGFYPSFFEAPLWRAPYYEIEDDLEEIGRLLAFLEPTVQVRQGPVSVETLVSSIDDSVK